MSARATLMVLLVAEAVCGPVRRQDVETVGVSPHDRYQGISMRTGKNTDIFMRPDTAHINLQVLPTIKQTRPASQALPKGFENSVADANARYMGDIMIRGQFEGAPLDPEIKCDKHLEYNKCLLDVECGWCEGPKGSFCAEGSFAGPCNASLACPVYVTYQQEGMGAHDCGTGRDPCEDQIPDMFKTFQMPMTPFTDESEPDGTIKPIPGFVATDTDDTVDPSAGLGKMSSGKTTSKKDDGTSTTTEQILYDGPSLHEHLDKILVDPAAVDNISEEDTPSPCGLPGTSQDMCNAWVATHCIGEKANSDPSCQLALSIGVAPPVEVPPAPVWPPVDGDLTKVTTPNPKH